MYLTWNILSEKLIIFWPISGKSGTFSKLAVIGAFCRCAIAEKRIHQQIYFSSFLNSKNVNLLFNSRIFMIEPIYHRVLIYFNLIQGRAVHTPSALITELNSTSILCISILKIFQNLKMVKQNMYKLYWKQWAISPEQHFLAINKHEKTHDCIAPQFIL